MLKNAPCIRLVVAHWWLSAPAVALVTCAICMDRHSHQPRPTSPTAIRPSSARWHWRRRASKSRHGSININTIQPFRTTMLRHCTHRPVKPLFYIFLLIVQKNKWELVNKAKLFSIYLQRVTARTIIGLVFYWYSWWSFLNHMILNDLPRGTENQQQKCQYACWHEYRDEHTGVIWKKYLLKLHPIQTKSDQNFGTFGPVSNFFLFEIFAMLLRL